MENWCTYIFDDGISFDDKAETVFRFQYQNNPIYRRFCNAFNIDHSYTPAAEENKAAYPLIPIRAFKDRSVTCSEHEKHDLYFKSSGTSSMERSIHYVSDSGLYLRSIRKGFRKFYNPEKSVILAYLPGYQANPHSSLVWMIESLIKDDESGLSRMLETDSPLDKHLIQKIAEMGKYPLLFGAAFGLLDLVDTNTVKLPSNAIVIETGGMKTHRREINRKKLHKKLSEGFGVHISRIHSEYGMTELLSQAYATGGEWFHTVPWMQVSVHNPENPLEKLPFLQEGLMGITDLANVWSCSFLLTGDKGVLKENGQFKVLGRWNPRDLRGCNFMVDED